ncbi:DoxX family protein [Daejeonella sp.]|uniref:DoxX family protein n=1 Tax=Daejeonella sp. TaxID=2805397 RepID=UPI0030BEB355
MKNTNVPSGKAGKITYWISTIWLALGMTSTGVVQLLKLKEEADMITRLGYPLYFLTVLGVWKLLGVTTILLPGKPVFLNLLREWAYAGFFFAASGAVLSHLAVGDSLTELFGPMLLLILTVVSWYFRPDDRKTILVLSMKV